MIDACIDQQVHYLDITGEMEVFALAYNRDQAAQEAGIMLLPGCGFDIVPSDCLAAKLAEKYQETDAIDLVIGGLGGGPSKGTALSAVNAMGQGTAIRQSTKLIKKPFGKINRTYRGNGKERFATSIPWGDVFTAYHSTGVPNTRVFLDWPASRKWSLFLLRLLEPLLRLGFVKDILRKRIQKQLQPPTPEQRRKAKSIIWGEARNRDGEVLGTLQLEMPEGYTLTAMTAVEIANKVLQGRFIKGFQTPSKAYGSQLISEIEGMKGWEA
jgi:short subunit dehydrogenase-like uncharacterized protein